MPHPDFVADFSQKLNDRLEKLRKLDKEQLARERDWGVQFSFRPILPLVDNAIRLGDELLKYDLTLIADAQLTAAIAAFDAFTTRLAEITGFNADQPDAKNQRARLLKATDDAYRALFNNIAPLVSFAATASGTSNEKLVEASDRILEFEKQAKQTKEGIDALLASARQAASEVGVTQHARHFSIQAEEHKKAARNWLALTVLVAVLIAIWGLFSIGMFPEVAKDDPYSTAKIVHFMVSKLVVLSALFYALALCGRSYSANRHNYVVNVHRQNALSSFETFVQSARDADTKNAVLLQATQSIFSPQASGYNHPGAESESPNKIIEILRTVGSSQK